MACFYTTDSLQHLQAMTAQFPDLPVYFAAQVTYSLTPDMVPWRQWSQALAGLRWHSIGARTGRYPQDTPSLWRWQARLAGQTTKLEDSSFRLEPGDLDGLVTDFQALADQIPMAPLEK